MQELNDPTPAAQRPPSSIPNPYSPTPYTYNAGAPLPNIPLTPEQQAAKPVNPKGDTPFTDVQVDPNKPKPTNAEALNLKQNPTRNLWILLLTDNNL